MARVCFAVLCALFTLGVLGCKSMKTGASEYFGKKHSCPDAQISVIPRTDLKGSQIFEIGRDAPPDEVKKNPARLAVWQQNKMESTAEHRKILDAQDVFEVRGCGFAEYLTCYRFYVDEDIGNSGVSCSGRGPINEHNNFPPANSNAQMTADPTGELAKELGGNAGGPGRKVETGGNSTEKQVASGLEKDTGIGNKKVDIEGSTKTQKVVRVGSSDGEATGELPKAMVKSYIATKMGAIISCYEKGLRANPDLSGKVKVAFLIQPTGGVLGARVDDSSLNNSSVEECILNKIKNWQFPPAKGGGSTKVVYPFVFSSTH